MSRRAAGSLLAAVSIFTCSGFFFLHLFLKYPGVLKKWSAMWIGAEFLGTEGVVLQKSLNDCGPAALAMVLDHFGVPVPFDSLRKFANLKANGSSMLALGEIAGRSGISAEGWRLTFSDLQKAPLPGIALIRRNHFVVITALDAKGSVYASDPSLGKLRFSRFAFLRQWRGEILLFARADRQTIADHLAGPRMRRSAESGARNLETKGGESHEK